MIFLLLRNSSLTNENTTRLRNNIICWHDYAVVMKIFLPSLHLARRKENRIHRYLLVYNFHVCCTAFGRESNVESRNVMSSYNSYVLLLTNRCAVSLAEKGEVWCLASLFALGLDPLCRHPDSGEEALVSYDRVDTLQNLYPVW